MSSFLGHSLVAYSQVGEPCFLPLIAFGPIVAAQIGMFILSTRVIRAHMRRRKAGRRT
jgi:hypothetical protein